MPGPCGLHGTTDGSPPPAQGIVSACSATPKRPVEHAEPIDHIQHIGHIEHHTTGDLGTMAKRRDELAAYTFARKRTVAAFLAPSPGGSDEGAPRPVHMVMPSLAVGVVLVVGFIAWG